MVILFDTDLTRKQNNGGQSKRPFSSTLMATFEEIERDPEPFRQQFERDGFLVVNDFLDAEKVAALRQRIRHYFEDDSPSNLVVFSTVNQQSLVRARSPFSALSFGWSFLLSSERLTREREEQKRRVHERKCGLCQGVLGRRSPRF